MLLLQPVSLFLNICNRRLKASPDMVGPNKMTPLHFAARYTCIIIYTLHPKGTESLIEDQSFLCSFDLAPPTPSRHQVLSLSHSSCVSPVELTNGGEEII
jgi:hypothetical protein